MAPAPFAAVGVLSGSVVGAHVDAAVRQPPSGVPLFIGHGRLDAAVPVDAMRGAVGRLRGAGRSVVYHESDAPHVVTRVQRDALSGWLRPLLTLPDP